MKKIKKILLVIALMLMIPNVCAASFSASANTTYPTVGGNVTVTVRGNGVAGKFSISSSNNSVISGGGTVWIDNDSKSVTFKVKSAGTATVTITPFDVSDYDGNTISGSKTIKINAQNPVVRSSINNLTELQVEGKELTPSFDKNTTEYSLELEPNITSINIKGTLEDNSSYANGLGDIQVSEGLNVLNVVVTAENGSQKTYTIKATVKEEEPIEIEVDNESKTLVRKANNLPEISDSYEQTSIKINEKEIPAYKSEHNGLTIVALKSQNGEINLYKYIEETGEYSLYKEYKFSTQTIHIIEPSDVPKGYKEETKKINDVDTKVYTKDGSYPLIYAMNVSSGEKKFYTYDESENTIQKYIQPKEEKDNKGLITISSMTLVILIETILLVKLISKKTKKEIIKNDKEILESESINDVKEKEETINENELENVNEQTEEKKDKDLKKEIKKNKKELKKQRKIEKNKMKQEQKSRKQEKNNKEKNDDMYKF